MLTMSFPEHTHWPMYTKYIVEYVLNSQLMLLRAICGELHWSPCSVELTGGRKTRLALPQIRDARLLRH